MGALAKEAVRAGAKTLEWGVHEGNARAIDFYRALGASGGSVRTMEVKGDELRALAEIPGQPGQAVRGKTARNRP
jgi:hypothetical protein